MKPSLETRRGSTLVVPDSNRDNEVWIGKTERNHKLCVVVVLLRILCMCSSFMRKDLSLKCLYHNVLVSLDNLCHKNSVRWRETILNVRALVPRESTCFMIMHLLTGLSWWHNTLTHITSRHYPILHAIQIVLLVTFGWTPSSKNTPLVDDLKVDRSLEVLYCSAWTSSHKFTIQQRFLNEL